MRSTIVMGVSGCGKSTMARMLAEKYDLEFIEGDALHSESNRQKMASGIPLNDDDRLPWLSAIRDQLATWREAGKAGVISCSALKKSYRDLLREGDTSLQFLFLEGDEETLHHRVTSRSDHFMPVSLLRDQLSTLENPKGETGVFAVDIRLKPLEILEDFISQATTH
ncbi:MAG: gluconokinase [Alphaproteobacteria bacterium]|nr:gluconokinase [Alphaproteobacteria bacterium]